MRRGKFFCDIFSKHCLCLTALAGEALTELEVQHGRCSELEAQLDEALDKLNAARAAAATAAAAASGVGVNSAKVISPSTELNNSTYSLSVLSILDFHIFIQERSTNGEWQS